jgi:nucleoid DNA-binding protein
MMYEELYQYLVQHKSLVMPGIGTFSVERKPAEIDFLNKRMNPPSYAIALQPIVTPASKNFFNWLADALHISANHADRQFSDFVVDIKNQITSGDIINWNGVGSLSKGLRGDVKFVPSITDLVFEKPVIAEKVIREKSEHMVRVGEDERTSTQMTEMLNQPDEKKSYWWAYALAIALLAIMFIGWYVSEHGVDISSTANGRKLVPQEARDTYKILP